MRYLLERVEVWEYDYKDYPKLVNRGFDFLIGKKYEVEEYKKIEGEIKKELETKYRVIDVMNPLYVNWGVTTISIDVVDNIFFIKEDLYTDKNSDMRAWIKELFGDLFKKHSNRLKGIISSGKGSMKQIRLNGALFSEDKVLNDLENKIKEGVENNKEEIFSLLEKGECAEALKSLQWLPKTERKVKILLKKIKEGTYVEKNLALKQFIPLMSLINEKERGNLANIIINSLLKEPTSSIRNKGLNLLVQMKEEIRYFPKNFIEFIDKIRNSNQYNCRYPAEEIKKSLRQSLKD